MSLLKSSSHDVIKFLSAKVLDTVKRFPPRSDKECIGLLSWVLVSGMEDEEFCGLLRGAPLALLSNKEIVKFGEELYFVNKEIRTYGL